MKKFFLFICAFLIIVPLWGEYYYQNDSEIFTLLHISRRMGRVLPFTTFPIHGSDVLDFAKLLSSNSASSLLNETETAMLENLISKLEEQKEAGIMAFGSLEAAYEHRFSTGAFMFSEYGIELPDAEDIHRAYLNFSPVLRLFGGIGTFDGIWVAMQSDIRPAWKDNFSPTSNFLTEFDTMFDMFTKGVFAWNSRHADFSIGRDSVHWGNPLGSTLYVSSRIPHMDGIRINAPIGPFTADYFLATIMPKRARYLDLDDVVKEDYPHIYTPENPLGPHFGFNNNQPDESPTTILFMSMRLQWNFGSVKTGIGATITYARANNQFLFTDILPVFNHHNADSAPNNYAFILDVQWAIIPGLTLSAMLGFDDINANDFGIPDGQTPTIPGAILQLEYSALNSNLFQYYMMEVGYTHYLWGNFRYNDKPESWCGVMMARNIYRYVPNSRAVLLPLTSPYGPGTLWTKFTGRFTFTEINLQAGFDLLLLFKNSEANLITTPYDENKSLNSYDQWFLTLDIPVSYIWRNFEFIISPAMILSEGKQAFECTLGVRFSLYGNGRL